MYQVFEGGEQVAGGFEAIERAVAAADRAAQSSPRSLGHEFVVLHDGIVSYTTHSCGPEFDAPAGAGDDVEAYRG